MFLLTHLCVFYKVQSKKYVHIFEISQIVELNARVLKYKYANTVIIHPKFQTEQTRPRSLNLSGE